MRKIITFLGVRPVMTSYSFQGKIFTGRVFAEALRRFVPYDQMLVCVTPEAQVDSWPVLAELDDPRIVSVPIPRGETTAEMWAMFDAITARVEQGEQVTFDITHGLRSLPFLVFLFAAYLKSAKQVTIEAIYYGALELGKSQNGKPAPVVDLSEFVTMLDWLAATDQFTLTGDARRLAELLNPGKASKGPAVTASHTLSAVSQAAILCQPFTLMNEVLDLESHLSQAETDLKQLAHPFGILRDKIVGAFNSFGAHYPQDVEGSLKAEYRMIEWYYQNKQLIQAMTLAREWLIDAVTLRLGRPLEFSRESRTEMERAVSGLSKIGGPHPEKQNRKFTPEDLNPYGKTIHETWPEPEILLIVKLWNALQEVRNALDHAEHQKSPLALKTISKKADHQVMPALRELTRLWDTPEPPADPQFTIQNSPSP
jgi:CRISPR-associated DxTHG motif protein